MGYAGLPGTGSYWTDINSDTKYELPLNLFIRLGISLNYDNRPAQNASETDCIVRKDIGWEWWSCSKQGIGLFRIDSIGDNLPGP